MSLYQKYRPQTFEEVVGQEEAKTFLKNIITKNKKGESIPQSYIFSGGHGIGKTTLARIFAKDLDTNPADIFEMDAATNNGIDEMRDLKESTYTLPIYSQYKIYILDEAHGLSKNSNNALLKILEEPPTHVIFIFCTTDPHKMLDTILSRCQIIHLNKADNVNLSKQLNHIAKSEKINIDNGAIEEIIKHSKGSHRDAISHLERCIHTFGTKISHEQVVELFSKKSQGYDHNFAQNLIQNIIEKNLKNVFELINKKDKVDNLYAEILEFIHNGMSIRQSENSKKNFETDIIKFVGGNATFFTSANILYFLEKENIFYNAKDKKIALIAIIGNFVGDK